MRALSENTLRQYRDVMARATGRELPRLADYAGVPYDYAPLSGPSRLIFRAALRRAYTEAGEKGRGIDEADKVDLGPKAVQKLPRPIKEAEINAIEKAANATAVGARALLITFMLRTGLRVTELLSLPRPEVLAALDSGSLIFVRKGGREKELPVGKVKGLLQRLLVLPRVLPHPLVERDAEERARAADPLRAQWEHVRETVSMGSPQVAYNMIWRALVNASREAGVHFTPHQLRRAFATRMRSDGADLLTIQKALGHEDPVTTLRYIRDGSADVLERMR